MTKEEQDCYASFRNCSTVVNYYRGDEISFSVDSVRMCRSYDKIRGRSKICCLLVVSSQSIGYIREDPYPTLFLVIFVLSCICLGPVALEYMLRNRQSGLEH